MTLGIQQSPVVVLSMNLHRKHPKVPQHARGNRCPANESAAAAIAFHGAPDDQRLTWFTLDLMFGKKFVRGMIGGQVELGTDACALLTIAHECGIGACAERKSKSIEEDGFASARFAGEDSKAGLEFQFQPLDQNHILDGELPQHVRISRRGFTSVRPSAAAPD